MSRTDKEKMQLRHANYAKKVTVGLVYFRKKSIVKNFYFYIILSVNFGIKVIKNLPRLKFYKINFVKT